MKKNSKTTGGLCAASMFSSHSSLSVPRHSARRRSCTLPLLTTLAVSLGGLPQPLLAGATTDSSWGRTPQSLSGNFVIPESMGRLAGQNLFQSFQSFSVNTGESATFTTATSSIQNVVSRVTGNQPSAINGLLRLQAASGSAPDFYFVNPSGVTFGAGAIIDVPAAFKAGTANHLLFSDGTVFSAGAGPDSTFTSAAPEAFGFLGGQSGTVRFDNASLALAASNNLTLAAGDVVFDTAGLSANGADIRLVAMGAESGSVVFSTPTVPNPGGVILIRAPNGRFSSISTADRGGVLMQAGSIALDNSIVFANTDTSGSGVILLYGRDGIRLNESNVSSVAVGPQAGHDVALVSDGSIDMAGTGTGLVSGIQTSTTSSGAAGKILVAGKDILVSGRASMSSLSGGAATGPTGDIAVRATGMLILLDAGQITSRVLSSAGIAPGAKPGSIVVEAGALSLNGFLAQISSDSALTPAPAGDVTVLVAGPLLIRNGAKISSSASANPTSAPSATQKAGNVSVKADSILIEGAQGTITGIFSDALGFAGSQAPGPGGPAGQVKVEARDIVIKGRGGISADTSGPGSGGIVLVKADNLLLDGGGEAGTSISTSTGGTGAGGVVVVDVANTLSLLSGAAIDASARSTGAGGGIIISAKNINVDGVGASTATGIRAISIGPGNSGDILISASEGITLSRGGSVTASTFSSGKAGGIGIGTVNLTIDGQGTNPTGVFSRAAAPSSGRVGRIAIEAGGVLRVVNGGVVNIANEALSPDLTNFAPQLVKISAGRMIMDGATIEASSTSSAPASAIGVNTGGLAMRNGSAILTTAQDGDGGQIDVQAGKFIVLRDSQIATSVLGSTNGNGGNINVTAEAMALDGGFIQANTAAPRAAGGDINLNLNALISSGNSLVVGGTNLVPFQPGVSNLNVIQAAAPDGVSGAIQITSPQLDLTGSLSNLSAAIVDNRALARDLCRVGAGSSLTPVGRGGLAPSAFDALRPEGVLPPPAKDSMSSPVPPVSNRLPTLYSFLLGCV